MPDDYHRKQTIAGGERFITPALKDYEEKVLGADEKILERELAHLRPRCCAQVAAAAPRVQESARALATLDVLATLGEVATLHDYTKPLMTDDGEFAVVDGRHPVVERLVDRAVRPERPGAERHDAAAGHPDRPEHGRQVDLPAAVGAARLLAQIGSFVPARQARLPVVDRVFARVGASDNIARGYSTFMVEMRETARILHTATSKSLVVLDEIGRGTATFDGMSIAWAVAEYLVTNPAARPRTLFATHYHELTDLADARPGVANAHVVVREWHDDIVFLRKVVDGRSDRSYGIQVARLAGLPPEVVRGPARFCRRSSRTSWRAAAAPRCRGAAKPGEQLGLFSAPLPVDDELTRRLAAVDVDRLTPLDALNALAGAGPRRQGQDVTTRREATTAASPPAAP